MDTKSYPPVILFTSKENFTSERKRAWKINKWLCVAYSDGGYKIFRMDTGLPLIPTVFHNEHKIIDFAKWIAKSYEPVWDIWEAWRECELLRIAQYTIPNGVEVYRKIEEVQSHEYIG